MPHASENAVLQAYFQLFPLSEPGINMNPSTIVAFAVLLLAVSNI
jgi:hypothetical protein